MPVKSSVQPSLQGTPGTSFQGLAPDGTTPASFIVGQPFDWGSTIFAEAGKSATIAAEDIGGNVIPLASFSGVQSVEIEVIDWTEVLSVDQYYYDATLNDNSLSIDTDDGVFENHIVG